jgi:glutamate formiminotransferase
MSLLAIPNVSEGTLPPLVDALGKAATSSGARLLDVHSDPVHDRSVFTLVGDGEDLEKGIVSLARAAARAIDLTEQHGRHPRVGALDVCPFVPIAGSKDEAVSLALTTARSIAELGIPVYLYGDAAKDPERRMLPDIRRGGLRTLITRASSGFRPDFGPDQIDPRVGVVCVGARDPLIAFNVWLECEVTVAGEMAVRMRTVPGVRAIGVEMGSGISQLSMNLTAPERTGVDEAFSLAESLAAEVGVRISGTEIVGLPPERFMPGPETKATRLLRGPGRSLESVLSG